MEDLSIYHASNLLHTQENMSKYRPGGFHPVCLGDTFKDGRYTIHHKLGWGGFSTVWLARDKQHEEWVSIKIKTADSSKESRELQNLQSLADISYGGDLSSKYIVQLLDHFSHQGPNGTHQCLVFELLGPTVQAVVKDLHEVGDVLEPEIILRISKQLLKAIVFLHEAGYAHGDISGLNVAFTSKLWHLSEDELFEVIGPPETEELARLDGKPLEEGLPRQLTKATGWDDWIDEDEEDIRVFDLGEAFPQGAEPEKLPQPGHLRAPETIFMDRCDNRHDLWRAGNMIYLFLFGAFPFQYWHNASLVAQMIYFVEELPTEWQQAWVNMRQESGWDHSALDEKPARYKLEQKFDEQIHDPMLKPLLPVIQGLVRFIPSNRISACQALDMISAIPVIDQD